MGELPKTGEKSEGYRSLETLQEKLAWAQKYFLTEEINPSTPEFAKPDEEPATFDWDTTLLRAGQMTPEIASAIQNALGVDLTLRPTHRTTGEIQYDAWPIPGATSLAYILKREIDGETEILALHEELIEMFPEIGELQEVKT